MTAAQLKAAVPALAGIDDAVLDAQILLADPYFDTRRWGDFLVEGVACWVAHNLTVGSVDDATKLVQVSPDHYMRTAFGQRYRFLADQAGMGGVAY